MISTWGHNFTMSCMPAARILHGLLIFMWQCRHTCDKTQHMEAWAECPSAPGV